MREAIAAALRSDSIQIPKVADEPILTGDPKDLQTKQWQSAFTAVHFKNFNTKGTDNYETTAYALFGKTGVFVALNCPQSSERITALQATNDQGIGLNDYAGVMLDTTGSGELTYYFETTPNGVRYQQSSESSRYRPTWTAVTSQTQKSWFAELFIPYDILRRSAKPTQHWRINFFRYVATRQHVLTWAYNPSQSSPYSASEWPQVTDIPIDLTLRRPSPNAEVFGLADFGGDRKTFEGPAGAIVSQSPRVIGLDYKIPITGLLNFVGTINPDFSNVESDQQLTTPQEFRRQYVEYRPFFAEGASFLPSSDVFYSASIGTFNRGEKVEGELDGLSIGILDVDGYKTQSSAFQVRSLRYNDQLSLSISGATNDFTDAYDSTLKGSVLYTNQNSKIGMGADYAINRGSLVTDPSQGNNWDVYSSIAKPNYGLSIGYSDTGAQYAPLNSYVLENDIHGFSVGASLTSSESTKAIKSASISAAGDRYFDESGAVRLADNNIYGQVTFKDLLSLSGEFQNSQLRSYYYAYPDYSYGTVYPYNQNYFTVGYLTGTPHAAYVSTTWGQFANYYLHQRLGSVSTPITKRISATFDFQQSLQQFDDGEPDNGQLLKRLSLFDSLSAYDSATLSYRVVSGTGGGAQAGKNLALSYLRRTRHGNSLIVEIGSPAAPKTLNRFILKYVQLIGGGVGL